MIGDHLCSDGSVTRRLGRTKTVVELRIRRRDSGQEWAGLMRIRSGLTDQMNRVPWLPAAAKGFEESHQLPSRLDVVLSDGFVPGQQNHIFRKRLTNQ